MGDATTTSLAPLTYWFAGIGEIPDAWRPRFGVVPGFWGMLSGIRGGDHLAKRAGQLGPAGTGRGLLVGLGDLGTNPAERLAVDRSRQEWEELEPGTWCGVAATAGPDDFLRSSPVKPVYLLKTPRGDWWLPVATLDSAACHLPTEDRLRGGEWRRVPAASHRHLVDMALELYRAETGETNPVERARLREIAIAALACNYALTPAEMGMLGLLNDAAYTVIGQVLTDWPARSKKAVASGTRNTDSGGSDA